MAKHQSVLIDWPISSSFGWGLRGLGYCLNFPGIAVSAHPQLDATLPPGDGRQMLLMERFEQSRRVQNQILGAGTGIIDEPVLVALGNNLEQQAAAFGRFLRGKPHVACPVFEDVDQVKANVERLKAYDVVVVASRWNQEVLSDLGVDAKLCHEGVDPIIFNPSVRNRQKDGKFRVFSGGKAEYRKGQDLAIEAFAEFAKTHDDAVLVACWGSPWPGLASTFEGKWKHGAPPGLHIGRPNYHAWVQKAGIKPHQFELVEPRLNWQMPEVYANVDAAIFPNRCEGGTNFVAMECMACGVPAGLSARFGHKDLGSWESGRTEFRAMGFDYEEEYQLRESLAGYLADSRMHEATRDVCEYWTWERHCRDMSEIIANA